MSQPIMVQLPRNKKQTYQLNSSPYMWPSDLTLAMTLTLNFQGQIWNFRICYISAKKLSNCHEMKSKHIGWTLVLTCDHQIWPWPWPWPWNFQGQIWNLLYFSKKWSDCRKTRSKLPIELKASNMTITYDLGHDLDSQGVGIYWVLTRMSLCCRLL